MDAEVSWDAPLMPKSLLTTSWHTVKSVVLSQAPLQRAITSSIWLRFQQEYNRMKATCLLFHLVVFWCRIDAYLRSCRKLAKISLRFLQGRRLTFWDVVDSWVNIVHFLTYCEVLPFSQAPLQRSITSSIRLRCQREHNHMKATCLPFHLVVFCSRIDAYSRSCGNLTKWPWDFCKDVN